jgi:DNA-binding transcriptional ArsR family regulator
VKAEYAILNVLFPKVRAEMLRLLFSKPLKQRYVRELTNMSGLALCTVQDELRKLRAIGLVTSWSDRRRRFYRSNRDHPFFRELLRIVELSARLPRTKQSALHRQGHSRIQKNKRRRLAALPRDRAAQWHIFARK